MKLTIEEQKVLSMVNSDLSDDLIALKMNWSLSKTKTFVNDLCKKLAGKID